MDDRAARLRQARLDAGFETAAAAAEAHGWNRNTYASNENGNAPYSWRRARDYGAAFSVRPEWLYDARGPAAGQPGPAPVIGRVGADPGGEVLLAGGQAQPEFAPLPPGWEAQPAATFDQAVTVPPEVLQHRALLQTPDGRPFSLLVETYSDRVLVP